MGLLNNDLGKKIYILPQEDVITTAGAPTVDNQAEVIILSATENFEKTESATLTQYPVSTGATVGDHYRFDGTTINFSGVIAGASTGNFLNPFSYTGLDSEAEVISYITKLRKLIRTNNGSSPLVTIYLPEGNGEANCVITSLRISKDSTVSNGYKVDVSARKLLLATTQFKVVKASDEYEPEAKQGQDTGSTVSKQITTDFRGL